LHLGVANAENSENINNQFSQWISNRRSHPRCIDEVEVRSTEDFVGPRCGGRGFYITPKQKRSLDRLFQKKLVYGGVLNNKFNK
jgi:hypothetical protein